MTEIEAFTAWEEAFAQNLRTLLRPGDVNSLGKMSPMAQVKLISSAAASAAKSFKGPGPGINAKPELVNHIMAALCSHLTASYDERVGPSGTNAALWKAASGASAAIFATPADSEKANPAKTVKR